MPRTLTLLAFLSLLLFASCNRLSKTYRKKPIYINPEVQLSIFDPDQTDFKDINANRYASAIPELMKKKFLRIKMRPLGTDSNTELSIRIEPLIIVVDKVPITVSQTVEKDKEKTTYTGHFNVYSAALMLNYSLLKNDSVIYTKNFTQEIREGYTSRCTAGKGILYALLTDRDKWEEDGQMQLQHKGFNGKKLGPAYQNLVNRMASDFKRASRRHFSKPHDIIFDDH